jgi:hypothetical protein
MKRSSLHLVLLPRLLPRLHRTEPHPHHPMECHVGEKGRERLTMATHSLAGGMVVDFESGSGRIVGGACLTTEGNRLSHRPNSTP